MKNHHNIILWILCYTALTSCMQYEAARNMFISSEKQTLFDRVFPKHIWPHIDAKYTSSVSSMRNIMHTSRHYGPPRWVHQVSYNDIKQYAALAVISPFACINPCMFYMLFSFARNSRPYGTRWKQGKLWPVWHAPCSGIPDWAGECAWQVVPSSIRYKLTGNREIAIRQQ